MAKKILKTQIQLRYDTWENWSDESVPNQKGNLVLLQGEVGITYVPDNVDPIHNAPTILFKVGNGTSPFKDLNWASGLAADVYSWAKAATKPTYTYTEVGADKSGAASTAESNAKSYTDTKIAALPSDTDTQYQLVLSGHTLKLQSKAKDTTAWSDVSGQSFTLPDNNTTYTFAEGTTSGAFTVTPSNGTATSVKVHGLGTAAYKATEDFATAAQGAKADSAIQSVKSLDTTATTAQATNASEAIQGDGKITLHKVSKTGSYTDLLNKPTIPSAANDGALTIKVGANGDVSGTGTFTANQSSAGTITLPVYTKTEIGSIVIDGGEIN